MNKVSSIIAELLGTFLLVFFGTGAIVMNDVTQGAITHLGVSIIFGIIVMAMIYAIGNVSGAHMNPAVSFAFFIQRKIKANEFLGYITAQFIGGIMGSVAVKNLLSNHETLGATLPSGTLMQAFWLEVLLSFVLMFVILNISTGHMEKGIMAGVAIGSTVFLCAAVGGPISGASMNPARSLGPALVSGNLQHLWIYFVAPIIGTSSATGVINLVQKIEEEDISEVSSKNYKSRTV